MKRNIFITPQKIYKTFFVVLFISIVCCKKPQKHNSIVDTYFGQQIQDDYRYLENVQDSTVLNWIQEQNTKTKHLLHSFPGKQGLIDKQAMYDKKRNYAIYQLQVTDNNTIFYLKRHANANVSKLYYRNNIDSPEIELFDPKDFEPESNSEHQINYFKPSWDGSKVVISINKNEDEYSQMIILDVYKRKIISEVIEHCKPTSTGGVRWLTDNQTISYIYLPNTQQKNTLNTKTVLYKTGTNPKDFKEILSKENNPEISIKPEDFPILDINNSKTKYAISVIRGVTPYFDSYYTSIKQLYHKKQIWKPLFKQKHEVKLYLIDNDSIVYLTAKNSPNFKICKTSILSPDFDNPQIVIREKKEEVIKYLVTTNKGLFFSTVINGVEAKLYRYFDGKETEIPLPKPAADIKLDLYGTKVIIATKGWLSKTERYEYQHKTESLVPYNLFPDQQIDPFDDLMVEEVTVQSKDGEEIPLSLVYKKGTKLDGSTPVLMRAYGAYGIPMTPNSYYPFLMYAREGGIYAAAHVRGGGEKGDSWYKGGHKATKPNSWKDFIACTEYLIANKYTSKGKIAIWSGSAGGIIIGRAITERPDLYNAAIIDRGMLNTIRLENGINGANSAKEFGSVKDSIEFKGLLEMDSYHHIKKGTAYPATLITTGLNDTRVPPWQSMKFAARLQEANSSDNPILLKTEFDSGHALQFTKDKEFNMMATALSFALWQTGHPEYQPKE